MTITMRRNLVLAFTFVFISLALILLDARGALDGPRELLANGVSPAGQALTRFGERVRGVGERSDSELEQELRAVAAERDALLRENARLRELTRDVEQLREQLGFQQARPDLQLLQADVIGRDPQGREQYLIINRGADDGLRVGMAVVSPNFLVGQITAVEPGRARVLLVIDSSFRTGAWLQAAQQEGIVYGRWQAGGRVVMRHLPIDTQLIEGELVVTSGRTELVPAGLVIGTLSGGVRNTLRNEVELEVVPLADFDNLRTVTVITGEGPPPS
jgi:rod shape-determining protein MreC